MFFPTTVRTSGFLAIFLFFVLAFAEDAREENPPVDGDDDPRHALHCGGTPVWLINRRARCNQNFSFYIDVASATTKANDTLTLEFYSRRRSHQHRSKAVASHDILVGENCIPTQTNYFSRFSGTTVFKPVAVPALRGRYFFVIQARATGTKKSGRSSACSFRFSSGCLLSASLDSSCSQPTPFLLSESDRFTTCETDSPSSPPAAATTHSANTSAKQGERDGSAVQDAPEASPNASGEEGARVGDVHQGRGHSGADDGGDATLQSIESEVILLPTAESSSTLPTRESRSSGSAQGGGAGAGPHFQGVLSPDQDDGGIDSGKKSDSSMKENDFFNDQFFFGVVATMAFFPALALVLLCCVCLFRQLHRCVLARARRNAVPAGVVPAVLAEDGDAKILSQVSESDDSWCGAFCCCNFFCCFEVEGGEPQAGSGTVEDTGGGSVGSCFGCFNCFCCFEDGEAADQTQHTASTSRPREIFKCGDS